MGSGPRVAAFAVWLAGVCFMAYIAGFVWPGNGPQEGIGIAVYDCTTDSDCYEKYGCGGYADPCKEE